MENLISSQGVVNCDFGAVYMALGEFDVAFKYFENAVEIHEACVCFSKYYFRFFPEFEQDPRTKLLLKKIGLPYQ
jgi:hypothetical protein